jgi:hypothetical protein
MNSITLNNFNEISQLTRDDLLIEIIEEKSILQPLYRSATYASKGVIVLVGVQKTPDNSQLAENKNAESKDTSVPKDTKTNIPSIEYVVGQSVMVILTNAPEVIFNEKSKSSSKYYLVNRKEVIMILKNTK